MAEYDRHLHAGELLGHRPRLLRVAGVVAHLQPELAAEHAPGGIDVGHRLFGAVLELQAECCVLAGHGTGVADDDFLCRGRSGKAHRRGERENGN